MDTIDKKQIRKFQAANEHERNFKITLMIDESGFGREIALFANELKNMLPNAQIKKEPVGVDELPGLYIGTGLRCHFIPNGQKLKGFLEALTLSGLPEASTPAKISELFGDLDLPADLRLYIAEGCPHCPKVLSQLIPIPFVNSKIRLSVFDPVFFPELMEKDAVRAVPTTLLDNDFRWTGALDLSELANVIDTRDPSNLGSGSLDMLLKEGNAMSVVEMFRESGHIYPAFIDLLTHPIWSTRLGAMVVMETLVESDPQLAAEIQQPIWQHFETANDPVKGDLLYIIGELRSINDVSKLKAIIEGEYNQDVKEAADEALAKMSEI